ncbi:MAG TPA: hypothetical protein VGJ00_04775 [Rhabdochlamydiaceae bacterium]|jgi:hypothetical protein
MKKFDWKAIETKELAGVISQHLKTDGIEAILVGGACVTIYSNNRYVSRDLDYVSHEDLHIIAASLKKIGFIKKGRHFEHPECPFFIDFVTEPVAIGNEIITKFEQLSTKYGSFKLLKPTDCVKDRLASFYYWEDRQSLDQALEICKDHKINMQEIRKWSEREGFKDKLHIFENEVKLYKNSTTDS